MKKIVATWHGHIDATQFGHKLEQLAVWYGAQMAPETNSYGAATLQAQCGKICVAVSEDVDPNNTDGVFWSMAYRSNPVDDVLVIPNRAGGHGPKGAANSTLLIDATAKHAMPPLALPMLG